MRCRYRAPGCCPIPSPRPAQPEPPGSASRFAAELAGRGIRPVSYADWLGIETAEKELAAALGRGARVKLPSREELHKACGLSWP